VNAFDLAQRYVGIAEIAGDKNHPLIQWWLSLCSMSLETPDTVAWCAAFVNGISWELRLPRSKSAAARSCLNVGVPTKLEDAKVGNDIVILKRGKEPQPGPEVTSGAPGHVGFFGGVEGVGASQVVLVLGGNQGDAVSLARFPVRSILGVRRLT
jgi:uncharacterized protein (TIGR02594 family)